MHGGQLLLQVSFVVLHGQPRCRKQQCTQFRRWFSGFKKVNTATLSQQLPARAVQDLLPQAAVEGGGGVVCRQKYQIEPETGNVAVGMHPQQQFRAFQPLPGTAFPYGNGCNAVYAQLSQRGMGQGVAVCPTVLARLPAVAEQPAYRREQRLHLRGQTKGLGGYQCLGKGCIIAIQYAVRVPAVQQKSRCALCRFGHMGNEYETCASPFGQHELPPEACTGLRYIAQCISQPTQRHFQLPGRVNGSSTPDKGKAAGLYVEYIHGRIGGKQMP